MKPLLLSKHLFKHLLFSAPPCTVVLRVYLKCWSFTRIAGAGALLRRDDMQPWYIILSVRPSVCRSRDLRNKKLERTLQRLSRRPCRKQLVAACICRTSS